jgi:hypothetical protein
MRSGEVPWAVRISSREDPMATWVEEGSLHVAPFSEVNAEVAPSTSRARGRRRGKHQLALDNRGNVPAEVHLYGGDDEGQVTVEVNPRIVVLQPGTARIVKVRPRARKRFWSGPSRSHPFKVVVDRGDGAPQPMPATLLQETVVPGWLVKAVIGLILLAAILVGLWATVLKATIQDAARAAAEDKAAAVAKKEAGAEAKKAVEAAKAGGGQPAPSPSAAAKPAPKPSPKPSKKPDPKPIDPLGDPVSFRIGFDKDPNKMERVLSGSKIVSITDMFFQNPEGDAGKLEILRNDTLLYTTRLNNWHDLDNHATAPFEFKPDDVLKIRVTCENNKQPPPQATRECSPAVTVVGYARKPAEE